MMIPAQPLIIQAKLAQPRLQKHTLSRPRLTARLLEAPQHRLTILQAGAGYGKSTALAQMAQQQPALIWYNMDPADRDPFLFLTHLLHAFATLEPQLVIQPVTLFNPHGAEDHMHQWTNVVDRLNNTLALHKTEPIFLVLDDVHQVNESATIMRLLDWLIGRAAPSLHILLATRYPLNLPHLLSWRIHGQVLEINQHELAFNAQEIAELLANKSGSALTAVQTDQIATKTEGWAIALQLIRQQLIRHPETNLRQALDHLSTSEGDLFTYLTGEVVAQLPADLQDFLSMTSVLPQLDVQVCNYLWRQNDSLANLRYLEEHGLFVFPLGPGQWRYHPLFQELLTHQLDEQAKEQAHLQAAAYYQEKEEWEAAIDHLLAANSFPEAADLIVKYGRKWIRGGRIDNLAQWIGALPPETLETHPQLLSLLGDVARLHSHFDEALGWYQQAETRARAQQDFKAVGQALRGQARVYLDTVNPSKAEELLQEALALSDGQESREGRARLLELLAENLLNRGQIDAARGYQDQARTLREEGPNPAELSVRLLIRSGRLVEARTILETRVAAEETQPVQRPRAHRETLLLLSLIMSFQGEQEAARQTAEEGTQRGRELASPFITAVGFMRQGHAWLLNKNLTGYEKAIACFQEAIAMSETLMVPRLKVEACWGLAQAHGFRGELDQAVHYAEQGLAIARDAGDEWIEGMVRTVVGAAHILAGKVSSAQVWLDQAATIFAEVRDTFGQSVVWLWRCLGWHQADAGAYLSDGIIQLLSLVRRHDYTFLLLAPTLLGPPDERYLVPLLILASSHDWEGAFAREMLAHLGLPHIRYHPGYQLRIRTLGDFQVWRGLKEIQRREWQRQKARDLILLLVTYRGHLLERDQIVDMLWPGRAPPAGERDFKAAYNQMCQVLEPGRKRNAPSAYILRDGSCYGLRPEADLWIDADEFLALIAAGDKQYPQNQDEALSAYRQALALYQGEYFSAHPYAEWCSEERERLLTAYLQIAERVAKISLDQEQWEPTIQACRLILARDDCWESAYRMMMIAHARLGNSPQVVRTYQRCAARLQNELGLEPSTTTTDLYQKLIHIDQ
jgi:ATP/maltotriose-dependent transcriptional regulator MalT/two-component SAPR family response regulator